MNRDGRRPLRPLLAAAMLAAMLAAVSQVIIPIGVVPLTLQIMVVWLSGGLLGWRYGALSVLIWLLLAAAGLPVLAGGQGGLSAVLGPRIGFLLGFPVCAALSGLAGFKAGNFRQLGFMLIGLAVVYVLGTAGLLLYSNVLGGKAMAVTQAIKLAVVPFVALDLVKAVATLMILQKIRRIWPGYGAGR
ncbi:MAG: biotin transporter BioY [Negativicutes bacterium]|nr:biotin transporter BioY [Negativicutes bacterium]